MGQLFKSLLDHSRNTTLLSQQDSVIVNRLKIGHARCTYSYLLSSKTAPECISCQCPLPARPKHFLLGCIDFYDVSGNIFKFCR